MKKTITTAISTFLIISSISAQADNLLDVYNIAKDNDPIILASEAGRMAANERVNQTMASLLPQLNASAKYAVANSESNSTTTGTFTPASSGTPPVAIVDNGWDDNDQTTTGYSVVLQQEIYNHASWLNLRLSEKRALQSNITHEGAKLDLIVRVAESYFNVLAAKDSVAFAKSETEAVSKELAQTKQRHEVGLIAMTDVHEAQSRHDRAVANQIATQNSLDNSHEVLHQLTGQYHYNLLALKEKISLRKPQPENIDQWVKASETSNIDLKASKVAMEIAKKSISAAQAGHYPTLNLEASYSDMDTDTDTLGSQRFNNTQGIADSNVDGSGQDSGIAIKFNVPIYSGGRTHSQSEEAHQLYIQAAHNMEGQHRRAVSLTRSSYLGVVAAVSSVKALNQAVISADSALEATQAGFEVGTRTIVDVLLQTQQLYDAKRQYARSRYDYILNTLKLKQAAGTLTEADLSQINNMLR